MAKRWTILEEAYLIENWGTHSLKSISEFLNRSEYSVLNKINKLKLGAFLENGDYITLNTLFKALGNTGGNGYKMTSWVKNRGLPIRKKRVRNCLFSVIRLEDFWKWAENNLDILDLTKLEPLALGKEPEWVAAKRNADRIRNDARTLRKWTPVEDQRLEYLLSKREYTTDEIAAELQRSEGAVVRRISTLGLKIKPKRNDPHTPWTTKELDLLEWLISEGATYQMLSLNIPRHSEKAIRGIAFRQWGTESLDKVRKILKLRMIIKTKEDNGNE